MSAQLQGELREKDVEITGLRARVTRLEVSTKIFRTCKKYLGGPLMEFSVKLSLVSNSMNVER